MMSKVISSFGQFIASAVSFVVYIVSRFVKVIALIVIGAIAIFVLGIIISGHIGLPYITLITPHPAISGYIGFYAGLIAFLIVPLIILVKLATRMIWKYRPSYRFKHTVSAVWILSFIMFLLTTAFTARNFLHQTSMSETISEVQYVPSEPLQIDIRRSNADRKFGLHLGHSVFANGKMFCDDVKVDFIPAKDDKMKIVKTTFSRGLNDKAAMRNLSYPSHNFSLSDNSLLIDDHYKIDKQDKYRAQRFHYVVSLPLGTEIDLNRSSSIFSHRELRWGSTATDTTWVMTEFGLQSSAEG